MVYDHYMLKRPRPARGHGSNLNASSILTGAALPQMVFVLALRGLLRSSVHLSNNRREAPKKTNACWPLAFVCRLRPNPSPKQTSLCHRSVRSFPLVEACLPHARQTSESEYNHGSSAGGELKDFRESTGHL